MFGYQGKLLDVDLSSKSLEERNLDKKDARKFVGGGGLACKVLHDRLDVADVDPLSPENVLVFMTGPLVGTKAPSSGRFEVCSKSPYTGIWGESNCGGKFGPFLKFAGFDGVLIKGKADGPLFLDVNHGEASLESADHLWGKGSYETQEILEKDISDDKMTASVIGQAGENIVPMACIVNDEGRVAGRGGMGAVMGSKKLKAVVARGDMDIELANGDEFNETVQGAIEEVQSSASTQMVRNLGTAGYMGMGEMYGDIPVKYYTESEYEDFSEISGTKIRETAFKKRYSCYGCPIGCGRTIETDELGETDGPEYETLSALGSLCLNSDISSIYKANRLCNDFGIDTISLGASISFTMYLYEEGLISEDDTDGIEVEWGDKEAILRLIEKASKREGFGELLAQGTRKIGEKYGKEEWAVHVKGLEIPMHDPRAFSELACSYATKNNGATHVPEQLYQIGMGMGIDEYDINSDDRFSDEGKGIITAKAQNYMGLFDSAVMCAFTWISPTHMTKLLSSATGFDYTVDSLFKTGERIFNVKRVFNNFCGIDREDDTLPNLILQPIEEGGTQGNVPDLEKQIEEYYDYRDWDWESGEPNEEKLAELGLEDYS